MKGINARTTCWMVFSFSWFIALAVIGHAYGGAGQQDHKERNAF